MQNQMEGWWLDGKGEGSLRHPARLGLCNVPKEEVEEGKGTGRQWEWKVRCT